MSENDNYDELAERIKLAVRQLNGTLDYEGVDKDSELIPEVAIRGTGYIFCFSPFSFLSSKSMAPPQKKPLREAAPRKSAATCTCHLHEGKLGKILY